ncbi:hypothetical protein [Gordonia araii]|uniref:hypothetical protein n=1 Tax=Gordonia araii TaxID=263909 RepID=UPI000303B605|nr:hypothetical protein [Gordonia araii]NNG95877.1 hypothetical protein [Gordonia araii NBRC 100433]
MAIGASVAIALAGLLAAGVAASIARRPDRAPVEPLTPAELDEYFQRRAAFAITVSARTPLAPDVVFDRLMGRAYLSSLPFLSGPDWIDGHSAQERGVWSRRTMSGTIYSVTEQVILAKPAETLVLTGTAVCTPATIQSFAERFDISTVGARGVTEVSWTVAGTPRWVGFLPWRWAAPLVSPVLAFVLRHILRLGAFRAPRAETA